LVAGVAFEHAGVVAAFADLRGAVGGGSGNIGGISDVSGIGGGVAGGVEILVRVVTVGAGDSCVAFVGRQVVGVRYGAVGVGEYGAVCGGFRKLRRVVAALAGLIGDGGCVRSL